MDKQNHLIVLCGPTGIGKTRVAIDLAMVLGCEILSADSRQLYKEMRIGTAVPSADELCKVPHHFIHSHSVTNYYNASSYEQDVTAFLDEYYKYKRVAILVGGSGLYIDAVCKGIDELPTILPEIRDKWQEQYKKNGLKFLQQKVQEIDREYFNKVDLNNPNRMLKVLEVYEQTGKPYSQFLTNKDKERPFKMHKIALNTNREVLYMRINKRVDQMVADGLVEEARRMLLYRDKTPLKTVGYKELFQHFDGEISCEEAIEKIKNHSRAYARRQLTWFRRDRDVVWFEPEDTRNIIGWIKERID